MRATVLALALLTGCAASLSTHKVPVYGEGYSAEGGGQGISLAGQYAARLALGQAKPPGGVSLSDNYAWTGTHSWPNATGAGTALTIGTVLFYDNAGTLTTNGSLLVAGNASSNNAFISNAAAGALGFKCATAGCRIGLNTTGSVRIEDDTFGTMVLTAAGGISTAGNFSSAAGNITTGDKFKFSANVWIGQGTGTPEGAVSAAVGSIFVRTDGGAGTSIYVKESGSGNTGWVGK